MPDHRTHCSMVAAHLCHSDRHSVLELVQMRAGGGDLFGALGVRLSLQRRAHTKGLT